MRLNRIDLNLLLVIDALLTERKVGKVALRLNVTQPAVSNALARLRRHFADPLFVQVGRDMVATDLALRLAEPIRRVLSDSRMILEARAGFDPATVERRFAIAVSDYEGNVLMPELARGLAKAAPRVQLAFRQMPAPADLDMPHLAHLLERRGNDCVLIPEQLASTLFAQEWLYDESYLCIAWRGNPRVKKQLGLEALLSLPHVVAEFADNRMPTFSATALKQLGHEVRPAIIVEQFSLIPQYVIGTERIAILHANLARQFAQFYPLKLLALPVELPPLRIVVQWSRRRDSDRGLAWLIEQIMVVAKRFRH